MKARYTLAAVAVASAFALMALSAGGRDADAQTPTAPAGDYIVVLKDGVPDVFGIINQIERLTGVQTKLEFSTALKGFSAHLTGPQVVALQQLPWVQFLSPDYQVQAVGSVALQPGDSAPTGVRRIEAATTSTARQASSVGVAVIDTGIDLTHPDLNAVAGKNCVSTSSQPQDDNGHGTHVSGTIGAKNTGSGVVGVAPGTTLYAVKVLNSSGSGTWAQVICGIDWVTANAQTLNIKVASMSLGGGGSNDNNCGNSNNDALHKAICNSVNAGVTYVVAAGNSGADLSGFTPAAYPEVLAVTAMSDSDGQAGGTGGAPTCRTGESDDRYASFSNYAVSSADINHTIAGPGTCIYSTWVSGSTHTYNTISGTSMATPHVSGSVALCLGEAGGSGPCSGKTPAQVIQLMRSNAQTRSQTPGYGFTGDPNAPVNGRYYGYLVANTTPPPPTPDFSVAASPSSRSVQPGQGTTFTVTVTGVGGYVTPVNLTVGGLPANANASFSPAQVTPSGTGVTSTLNITTAGNTPLSTSTLTITGTAQSGGLTHSTTVSLTVANTPPPDFTLSVTPSSRTVSRPIFSFFAATTTYTVTLTSVSGYSLPVTLSVSGLSSGITGSFNSNPRTPTAGGVTSTLTLSILRSATPGTRTLTITGVGSDNNTKTATVSLTVN